MNTIIKKYLSGEEIKIYHKTTTIDIIPAGILEKLPPDDMYIKVWDVAQKLKYFFDNLEYRVSNRHHEFIRCSDKSFTIRYEERDNVYREETFNFTDKALNNSILRNRFDKYIELAKGEYPNYEENARNEAFARNISNAIFNKTSLDMTNLKDIPEFYDFYQSHKTMVEKQLRQHFKEKYLPDYLDLLIRFLALLILNFAFFSKNKFPILLTIDIVLGYVIMATDIYLQKTIIKSTAEQRITKEIEKLQDRRLNGYSGFKNKVLKAIKTDIELTKHLKYDGYQDALRTLYNLADSVINNSEENNTNAKTDLMSDVLNKLIDIEQIICININYNGELNAEMLLNEYQCNPEEQNSNIISNEGKKLLYQ